MDLEVRRHASLSGAGVRINARVGVPVGVRINVRINVRNTGPQTRPQGARARPQMEVKFSLPSRVFLAHAQDARIPPCDYYDIHLIEV